MEQEKDKQRERWRGLFSEQKESGQSVAVFCRERGLREWQFYEWKKRLRPTSASPFVAVELVAASEVVARPALPEAGVPLEVRLRRGRRVLVGADFDPSHLQKLLRVLEQEP